MTPPMRVQCSITKTLISATSAVCSYEQTAFDRSNTPVGREPSKLHKSAICSCEQTALTRLNKMVDREPSKIHKSAVCSCEQTALARRPTKMVDCESSKLHKSAVYSCEQTALARRPTKMVDREPSKQHKSSVCSCEKTTLTRPIKIWLIASQPTLDRSSKQVYLSHPRSFCEHHNSARSNTPVNRELNHQ